MEGLHERFLRDLPVHPHGLGDVDARVAVLQRPAGEEGGQVAEVVGEGFAIEIGIDEDEAAPRPDAHLRQLELGRFDLREVPSARDALELAVQRPAEAVERALELLDPAASVAQGAPPMQAGVDVSLDPVRPGLGTHQQDRGVADVVDLGVADLGKHLLAAGELPHPRPQSLLLAARGTLARGTARPGCRRRRSNPARCVASSPGRACCPGRAGPGRTGRCRGNRSAAAGGVGCVVSGQENVSSTSKRRLRDAAPPALLPPLAIHRHSSGSARRSSPMTQRAVGVEAALPACAVGHEHRPDVVLGPFVHRAAERVLDLAHGADSNNRTTSVRSRRISAVRTDSRVRSRGPRRPGGTARCRPASRRRAAADVVHSCTQTRCAIAHRPSR